MYKMCVMPDISVGLAVAVEGQHGLGTAEKGGADAQHTSARSKTTLWYHRRTAGQCDAKKPG